MSASYTLQQTPALWDGGDVTRGTGQSRTEALRRHVMRVHVSRILRGQGDGERKAAAGTQPPGRPHHCNQGTIHASRSVHAEAAARTAREAMSGCRATAASLAALLTSHSNKQRQAVKRHYRLLYGKDLEADVADRLAGHFRTAVLALLQEPLDYLVTNLHAAIMKIGPDPRSFVELLYGHNSTAIQNIKESYNKKYGRDLTQAVGKELNGDFRRLLKILLSEERDGEEKTVNEEQATKEAQMLSRAGVGVRYGTDEAVIVSLLCERSYNHLHLMFSQYYHISGRSIQEAVTTDFKGTMRVGLLALVSAVLDKDAFFSTLVHDSLTRNPIKDDRLIYILVSHSEDDLGSIKSCYLMLYGTKLSSAIMDSTTGDYQQLMYRILDPN